MVKCENCEHGELVELESEDGVSGFMCEDASEAERESGSGCGALIPPSDFSERKRELAKTKANGKKRKAATDDEEDDEADAGSSESAKENRVNGVSSLAKPAVKKGARPSMKAKAQPLLPSSSASSLTSSSFREKLKLQAAARLSSSSLDLDDHASSESLQSLNSSAMLSGQLCVQRAPLMSSLSVKGEENPLADMYRRPFVRPRISGEPSKEAQQLMRKEKWGRRLGVRLHGTGIVGQQMKPLTPLPLPIPVLPEVKVDSAAVVQQQREKPGFRPLVIWQQSQLTQEERGRYPDREWSDSIEVPPCIAQFLREHQREGVQFLAECVLGLRRFRGAGAILADDMGLGKTLQSIALLYSLLTQGFERGRPTARRVVIVTPTSLVANWRNELNKWLQDRVTAIAISESSKGDVVDAVQSFLHPRSTTSVLIISYDTFRLHCALFHKAQDTACDLLICDEAHRLKNSKTSTYLALDALACKRRVLLSGTPLQNNLDEFYAMINFTNGGVLGDRKMFRKYYEQPILIGREPQADEEEQREGVERSAELSAIVNQFVLRRTNTLLSAHLPPKVMQVVCCRPTTLQVRLYDHLLKSKEVKRMVKGEDGTGGMRTDILPLITALKKLCNHPKMLYDEIKGVANAEDDRIGAASGSALARILKGCERFFHDSQFMKNPSHPLWSGKMYVLEQLLATLRRTTDDRVVIVSNSTSALDVIGDICAKAKWPFLRLDGSTTIKKRQKLVDQLTDRKQDIFCFLLSSRAGGCGLNLIGANRLVLFDPDWNPAVDKQAAARVWRDGQRKRCFIYRFLTTGSIEEKIYQRQLSKEGLAEVLGGGMNEAACSRDELRELFHIRSAESASDTHDHLQCDCLDGLMTSAEEAEKKKQLAAQLEEQQRQTNQQLEQAEPDDAPQPGFHEGAAVEEIVAPDSSPAALDASESECSDSDGDDGFVVNDGSASDDDFDDVKLRAAKGKGRKKKEKKARRSLKTSLVLDPLQLLSITKAMVGQRGSPPEEELINWAHHITGMSAPDPMFRHALSSMRKVQGDRSFVSFVFSCEVKGKQIGLDAKDAADDDGEEMESAETSEFKKYSARCTLEPVVKEKTAGVVISADDAWEKHRRMVEEHDRKRRKRLGLSEDGSGEAGVRRHSARITTRVNLSEDAIADEQMEGGQRRGRKRAGAGAGGGLEEVNEDVLNEADPETAALIKQIVREDAASAHSGTRKRGKKEELPEQASPQAETEEEQAMHEEDDDEDMVDVTTQPPSSASTSQRDKSRAQAKADTTDEDDGDEEGDDGDADDNSSVEVLATKKATLAAADNAARKPAMKLLPKLPSAPRGRSNVPAAASVGANDDEDFW